MSNNQLPAIKPKYSPWNKGRLIGQKRPLLAKQVWAIRARLELAGNLRDLALFNLAIDSKLRGCDLVRLRVEDLVVGDHVRERVSVIQSKTQRPVQFEVSEGTRDSIWNWVCSPAMLAVIHLFPSRFHDRPHVSTRQYARIVRHWVAAIGLDPSGYGTHSLRRTSMVSSEPLWHIQCRWWDRHPPHHLIQPPALSQEPAKSHLKLRLLRARPDHSETTRNDQTEDHRDAALALPQTRRIITTTR